MLENGKREGLKMANEKAEIVKKKKTNESTYPTK
jgi:hypothetical protein